MQAFKPYIELFLEPMFRCLSCENQLCRAAAGNCLGRFRDELGPRIFAGRLTQEQQAVMASSPDVPPPSGATLFTAPVAKCTTNVNFLFFIFPSAWISCKLDGACMSI